MMDLARSCRPLASDAAASSATGAEHGTRSQPPLRVGPLQIPAPARLASSPSRLPPRSPLVLHACSSNADSDLPHSSSRVVAAFPAASAVMVAARAAPTAATAEAPARSELLHVLRSDRKRPQDQRRELAFEASHVAADVERRAFSIHSSCALRAIPPSPAAAVSPALAAAHHAVDTAHDRRTAALWRAIVSAQKSSKQHASVPGIRSFLAVASRMAPNGLLSPSAFHTALRRAFGTEFAKDWQTACQRSGMQKCSAAPAPSAAAPSAAARRCIVDTTGRAVDVAADLYAELLAVWTDVYNGCSRRCQFDEGASAAFLLATGEGSRVIDIRVLAVAAAMLPGMRACREMRLTIAEGLRVLAEEYSTVPGTLTVREAAMVFDVFPSQSNARREVTAAVHAAWDMAVAAAQQPPSQSQPALIAAGSQRGQASPVLHSRQLGQIYDTPSAVWATAVMASVNVATGGNMPKTGGPSMPQRLPLAVVRTAVIKAPPLQQWLRTAPATDVLAAMHTFHTKTTGDAPAAARFAPPPRTAHMRAASNSAADFMRLSALELSAPAQLVRALWNKRIKQGHIIRIRAHLNILRKRKVFVALRWNARLERGLRHMADALAGHARRVTLEALQQSFVRWRAVAVRMAAAERLVRFGRRIASRVWLRKQSARLYVAVRIQTLWRSRIAVRACRHERARRLRALLTIQRSLRRHQARRHAALAAVHRSRVRNAQRLAAQHAAKESKLQACARVLQSAWRHFLWRKAMLAALRHAAAAGRAAAAVRAGKSAVESWVEAQKSERRILDAKIATSRRARALLRHSASARQRRLLHGGPSSGTDGDSFLGSSSEPSSLDAPISFLPLKNAAPGQPLLNVSTRENPGRRVNRTPWDAGQTILRFLKMLVARARLRAKLAAAYTRCYDLESNAYYYVDLRTGKSSWEPPVLLGPLHELPMKDVWEARWHPEVGDRSYFFHPRYHVLRWEQPSGTLLCHACCRAFAVAYCRICAACLCASCWQAAPLHGNLRTAAAENERENDATASAAGAATSQRHAGSAIAVEGGNPQAAALLAAALGGRAAVGFTVKV